MSFTALARGRYLEALAIDERVVWFSDVILGGVQGLQPDGSIAWFNPTTGRAGTLLSSIDGAPLAGVNEMCPDGRGGLLAECCSEELLCLRPDGIIQQRLVLPGGACTNVRFGGPDGREIFVTTVPLTAGLEIARGNLPSALDLVLYRGPSPVPGRINLRTAFRLGYSERQG